MTRPGIASDIRPKTAPRTPIYKPVPKGMPVRRPVAEETKPPAPRHLDIPAEAARFVGGILPPHRPATRRPAVKRDPEPRDEPPVESQDEAPVEARVTAEASALPPAGRLATEDGRVPALAGPASPRASSTILTALQYGIITIGALVAAFNSTAGQILVGLYAGYVLIRRPGSRLTFAIALFILLTIPLFQALGRGGIAENAAIYVYELLVIGTISALFELRKTAEPPN
jgi:hypothetical protein